MTRGTPFIHIGHQLRSPASGKERANIDWQLRFLRKLRDRCRFQSVSEVHGLRSGFRFTDENHLPPITAESIRTVPSARYDSIDILPNVITVYHEHRWPMASARTRSPAVDTHLDHKIFTTRRLSSRLAPDAPPCRHFQIRIFTLTKHHTTDDLQSIFRVNRSGLNRDLNIHC